MGTQRDAWVSAVEMASHTRLVVMRREPLLMRLRALIICSLGRDEKGWLELYSTFIVNKEPGRYRSGADHTRRRLITPQTKVVRIPFDSRQLIPNLSLIMSLGFWRYTYICPWFLNYSLA